jgi:signal transduction histidine kinase
MTQFEGADAPLAADAPVHRRAGSSGPRGAGVSRQHDVSHATNSGGDTVETLHAERNDRQIRLRQVGEATRRLLLTNASQLQQVSLNLCLNTIQAMDPGGELTVRVANLSPGMSDTVAANISDPFFTTKARVSGLGLTICRGITDAHRGTICAERNLAGPRNTIVVELPVPSTAAETLQRIHSAARFQLRTKQQTVISRSALQGVE